MPAGAERTATGLADEKRAFVNMASRRVVEVKFDSQEATKNYLPREPYFYAWNLISELT